MRGAIGSLNAAVAGSILLFAAVAQRDPAGLGDKPPARPVGGDEWPVRNVPAADGGEKRAKRPRGQSVVDPVPEAVLAEVEVSASPAVASKTRARKKAAVTEPEAASTKTKAKAKSAPAAAAAAKAAEPASPKLKPKAKARTTTTVKATTKAKPKATAGKTATEPAPNGDELLPGGPDAT